MLDIIWKGIVILVFGFYLTMMIYNRKVLFPGKRDGMISISQTMLSIIGIVSWVYTLYKTW